MTPSPNRANMSTGTHIGLTLCSLGMGGVYRDDAGGVTRPPFGVVRPARTTLVFLAMGGG